jgi:hypothetical protein
MERGTTMLTHAAAIGVVLYVVMVFGLKQQNDIAENRSLLLAAISLIYMILYGHGLPLKLNKNLAFTISSSSSKSTGVHIEIISAGERERSTLVTFGILTFLYGASIYYFLPLSLLSINLTRFKSLPSSFKWSLLTILDRIFVK